VTTSKLLFRKKFGPLFWALFFGALNDNFLKNALVILITYKSLTIWGLAPAEMVALSGGIFILPFFIFSTLAGELSDKYEKSKIVRWTKGAEIILMIIACYGFIYEKYDLLIGVLFFTGLQSTFFGPVKYSILPQHLDSTELVAGNALVELGTFIAILLGTITGGILINMQPRGAIYVCVGLLGASIAGYLAARFVPPAPSFVPQMRVHRNPITPFIEISKIIRSVRSVFLSILGISWFWLFGSVVLSILPIYTKDFLSGNETVVSFFLAIFTIGVATGSILCDKLSFNRLELGLVPLGAFFVTLFTLDLAYIGQPYGAMSPLGILDFLAQPKGIRISFDLFMLSVASGFMIVPLYTLIQQRCDPQYRSRTIAGNNILNALFMVIGAVGLTVLLRTHVSIPKIFALLAIANFAVSIYIYTLIPEFFLRFIVWMLVRVLYRLRTTGLQNIPQEGPALLICNHVSFVDWLIIAGAIQRPVRFVMDHNYAKMPLLSILFRHAKVIPIAPKKENSEIMERAFEIVSKELRDGELVCIFPEGKLTRDGQLNPFRPGVERILAETPVPVVPMLLDGLWGSFFSHKEKVFYSSRPRPFLYRVGLHIGNPISPQSATASNLQKTVESISLSLKGYS